MTGCPCSNQTCLAGIIQTGGNLPAPQAPNVTTEVAGFRELLSCSQLCCQPASSCLCLTVVLVAAANPVGPLGTTAYTLPLGPTNVRTISILGVSNVTFTSTGPVFPMLKSTDLSHFMSISSP